MQIILASASPRRIGLLKKCGLKFKVLPSRVRENTGFKSPVKIVKYLALKKAFFIAKRIKQGIVIGADTIVVFKGHIIGKPKDSEDAGRILSLINGTFHRVYSGVAVVDAESLKYKVGYEMSRVKMRKLSKTEINSFVGKHLDKAGAYAVQEKDDAFVEKICGDYYNVVGLPLKKLKKLLSGFCVTLPGINKLYTKHNAY